MLVNMNEIAKREGKCIPQFNINNLEWAKYILEECQNLNYPVILGVSEGASKYMGGYKTVVNMVKGLIEDLNISINVAIHLDHSRSADNCKKAIDAGFTSVMIDASAEQIDKNIEITKEVVEYAHLKNASVEAEVGSVGGSEDDVMTNENYAKVEDCVRLVNETNIDFLAPALGSVHGLYKGEPNLQFDRMAELNSILKIPLVLHGGSGLRDEDILNSIKNGTRKVNINTELQIEWAKGIREKLSEDENVYDPRKIISAGEANLKSVVKRKIELYDV